MKASVRSIEQVRRNAITAERVRCTRLVESASTTIGADVLAPVLNEIRHPTPPHKRRKSCGVCGSHGRNARTCPNH